MADKTPVKATFTGSEVTGLAERTSSDTIGVADGGERKLRIHGGASGSAEGGQIELHTAADHDSTYAFYRIDAYQDDLRIGRAGAVDITLQNTGNVVFANNITGNAATFSGDITTSGNIVLTGAANEIIKSNGSIRLNIDSDNNQKKVTVVIDPKKLAQDKDVFKKIKKAKKTKVNVDTSGTVQLQSTNEAGSIDKTTTNVLNNNKLTEFIDIAPSEILNVETQIIDNKYYLELPIVKAQNSEEFEIVQEDGQKLPEWIKIDPFTGQIIAEPPSDVENIKLKIISENEGGEVVIKEVQLDFNNQNDNTEKLTDPETTFEPLNTQLAKAQVNFDDYGDKLLRSL